MTGRTVWISDTSYRLLEQLSNETSHSMVDTLGFALEAYRLWLKANPQKYPSQIIVNREKSEK